MALKVFAIVLLLFVLEIAFLTTHEPITLDIRPLKVDFSDVTLEKIQAYVITPEGIELKLKAQEVLAYKNRNILHQVDLVLNKDTREDYLCADKAVQRGEIIHLINNIQYHASTSKKSKLLLKTDDLVYNMKKKVAISSTPFLLWQTDAQARGDSFVYKLKENVLTAQNIHFSFKERE